MRKVAFLLAVTVAVPLGAFAADPKVDAPRGGVAVRFDISPPLRELASSIETAPGDAAACDPAVSAVPGPSTLPPLNVNFAGMSAICGCAPPSPNVAVGPSQVFQTVNLHLQIFNKSGVNLYGPAALTALFSGFGGVCQTSIYGDPNVFYDQLADRWVIGAFAGSGSSTDECVAVSTSSDATGSYYRWDFHLGSNNYNLPKLTMWPDAYYMSADVYDATFTNFLGPQPFAFDRVQLLAGNPLAGFVTFGTVAGYESFLPASMDGLNLPPAGSPNPYLAAESGAFTLFRFHVDWVTPANSTFSTVSGLTPTPFTVLCPATRICVPQLGSASPLDGLGGRAMDRLAYRRFADGTEALVGNRAVLSNGVAGIRWWEMSNVTSGTPTFVQEGTYQPDTTWRWAGSAATDAAHNFAIGFSASSATLYPEIRYAGRVPADPPGTLGQGEATIIAGAGSQTGTANRWGDYTSLAIDPADGCTFWYTGEYYATTSSFNWKTQIASFTFPNCTPCVATDVTHPVVAAPAAVKVTQTVCAP